MQAAATNEAPYSKKICPWTASEGFELLTDDLIIEILSWLPVKCLMRYMSVCKLWFMIIKSRKFIEKHMQQAKSSIHFTTWNSPPSEEPFWFLFTIDGLIIERSKIHGYYRIRNHATNWALELPGQGFNKAYVSMSYLPSSEKYKVLIFHRIGDYADIYLKVLTVGVDVTWRPVEVPISFCNNEGHVVINITITGVTYMMKSCISECCKTQILAFQTEDESFVEIPMPQRVKVLCWTRSRFRVIDWYNKFGIWCMVKGEFHIWVLQDYKKAEWDERKIVLPSSVIKQYPSIKKFHPYKVVGTVLFMATPDISLHMCYELKSKKVVGEFKMLRIVATSLVSLT